MNKILHTFASVLPQELSEVVEDSVEVSPGAYFS